MNKIVMLLLLAAFAPACAKAPDRHGDPGTGQGMIDPAQIEQGPYRHQTLQPEFLARVRATTDVFEKIDGISYEHAIDLYRRDVDPEKNIVPWEAMAAAYLTFCESRCSTTQERKDVYDLLLLRTMFPGDEVLKHVDLKALSIDDANVVIGLYRLAPQPIEVYSK